MRMFDGILILFMLLLAGLMYWGGYSFSQHESYMDKLAYIENKPADELNYNFLPRGPGSYEIIAFGHFKNVKNNRTKENTNDSFSIANVSVTRNSELIATTSDVLHLVSDTALRRIKVVGFTVNAQTEHGVSFKLEGIPEKGIEIVVASDPHEYKDNIISALLLKVLSYVLLFVAVVFLIWRIYAVGVSRTTGEKE